MFQRSGEARKNLDDGEGTAVPRETAKAEGDAPLAVLWHYT